MATIDIVTTRHISKPTARHFLHRRPHPGPGPGAADHVLARIRITHLEQGWNV